MGKPLHYVLQAIQVAKNRILLKMLTNLNSLSSSIRTLNPRFPCDLELEPT